MNKAGMWIAGIIAIFAGGWLLTCLTDGYGGIVAIGALGIVLLLVEQKRMNDDERNR